MAERNLARVAQEIFGRASMANKYHQVIFNVQFSTTPTRARITFVPLYEGVAWVDLYNKDGRRIRGGPGVPYAPGHYGATFEDLPQNSTFRFRILVTDPRPQNEQLPPGGVAIFEGMLQTGRRTAMVHINALKELQGEGEITYLTKLYRWDGRFGRAISDQLQYGRAHMDPEGSPIGSPFGPPLFFNEAPDAIAFYTLAVVDTSSFWSILKGGLGIAGTKLPDQFPNDAPGRRVYENAIHTTAQRIVELPSNEGPFSIPFAYMSGISDYVFEVRGRIEGDVSKFRHFNLHSFRLRPADMDIATAVKHSPRASVVAGDASLDFHLTPAGDVLRLRADGGKAVDFEQIGTIQADRLVAAGRRNGDADLIALRKDGVMLYARAAGEGAVSWREIAAELVGPPAVARAPDGALHVFALNRDGMLLHARPSDDGTGPIRWTELGQGFSGHVTCAADDRGDAQLIAGHGSTTVHARIALEADEIAPPRWIPLEGPCVGPLMLAATQERRFAALGCDEAQVFWMATMAGGEVGGWSRIGTIEDLLSNENEEHDSFVESHASTDDICARDVEP